jgi:molybdenum cofactor guanylyltransferase
MSAPPPVGAVLAGGLGRRIGGDKGMVELDGRPLIAYPIAALRAVLDEVVIVARAGTQMPADVTRDVPVWTEPDDAIHHPACGIVHALRCAAGRAVLVVAGDMPLLSAALLRALAFTDAEGAPALVPRSGGFLQPLCARYEAAALPALERFEDGARMTDLAAALGPAILEWPEERPFLSVNAPEDVLAAVEALRHPNVNA